jgi:hypothetical protein
MNARHLLLAAAALPAVLLAQDKPVTAGERPPVTVTGAPANAHPSVPAEENQKLFPPPASLVAPDSARAVVEKFRAAYEKLGKPRLVFSVNRELIPAEGALALKARTENTEATRSETKGSPEATSEKVTATNTYEAVPASALSLADRQTIRDVERLFGRPFRAAGAALADQGVAAALLADKPFNHFAAADNDQARKQREALTKVADVVIEVLISSRQAVVPGIAGDSSVVLPDIQATAIRLSDSAILGQATARDVLGRDRDAAHVRQFDVNDIAEATALALMEDIAAGQH